MLRLKYSVICTSQLIVQPLGDVIVTKLNNIICILCVCICVFACHNSLRFILHLRREELQLLTSIVELYLPMPCLPNACSFHIYTLAWTFLHKTVMNVHVIISLLLYILCLHFYCRFNGDVLLSIFICSYKSGVPIPYRLDKNFRFSWACINTYTVIYIIDQ